MNEEILQQIFRFLLPTQQEEEEIEKGAMKLADAGWALCPVLPPKHFQEIADTEYTNDELNQIMVEFYTTDNGIYLNELIQTTLLESSHLSDWQITISQSKVAYDAELYNVVVPALFTVVEGFLSKLVGTYATNNVRMIGPTKAKATGNHKHRFDKSTWLTIFAIVNDLYQKSDFSGSAPTQINRHWVLHGRHTQNQAKIDAIKLFNLLGAMSLTVAH